MKVFDWDFVVVQVPEQLHQLPRLWDPRLAWHHAYLTRSFSMFPVDWALGRENVDGIAATLGSLHPEELHLWCKSWRSLNRARLLMERMRKVWRDTEMRIYGLPKMKDDFPERQPWIGELDLKVISRLEPTWASFLTDVYFQNNVASEKERTLFSLLRDSYLEYAPQPWTKNTINWRQRGSMCFRFPVGAIEPPNAARILQKTKSTWWFDSLDWLDDLTEDIEWSYKVLREAEKREIEFQFLARGNPEKVTPPMVKKLREGGLAVMDFGEVPVSTWSGDDLVSVERLRGAFIACRSNEVRPIMSVVIDRDATLEAARRACMFCVEFRLNDRPEVQVVPEELTFSELDRISGGGWYNPTGLSDLELMGLQGCFEQGRANLIK